MITATADRQTAVQSDGQAMHALIADLYPICRSITGPGVRETLRRLQRVIPLEVHEVPSGTPVFDWTVPREWTLRDAYVKNQRGERVIDFQQSNLHVMSYSVPVHAHMPLAELASHLHTLPDHPDWIPYRTTYYNEQWGFCLTHRQYQQLADETYEVCIDASLAAGSLTYGEFCVPGELPDEVLVSCHICHPSLCNDNLSGIVIAAFLAGHVAAAPRRLTYRFLFIPGTIGSITWLALNEARVGRIRHGLILAGVGDPGPLTYKRSRRGNAAIDRIMAHVLKHAGLPNAIIDFSPYGYDERQYCSPGFNLPVGVLSRTPFAQYPQYHTSADDLTFVQAQALEASLAACQAAVQILEQDRRCRNLNPHCEPQLGRRGLYRAIGGPAGQFDQLAILWVLNLSDGDHSLLDIAERSGYPFATIQHAAWALQEADLLAELPEPAEGT